MLISADATVDGEQAEKKCGLIETTVVTVH